MDAVAQFVLSVSGLSFMILGITQFFKRYLRQYGLDGDMVVVFASFVGAVLSMLFYAAHKYAEFTDWYVMLGFGILGALTAAGIYDFSKMFANK